MSEVEFPNHNYYRKKSISNVCEPSYVYKIALIIQIKKIRF